jgi:hypothetical protein
MCVCVCVCVRVSVCRRDLNHACTLKSVYVYEYIYIYIYNSRVIRPVPSLKKLKGSCYFGFPAGTRSITSEFESKLHQMRNAGRHSFFYQPGSNARWVASTGRSSHDYYFKFRTSEQYRDDTRAGGVIAIAEGLMSVTMTLIANKRLLDSHSPILPFSLP